MMSDIQSFHHIHIQLSGFHDDIDGVLFFSFLYSLMMIEVALCVGLKHPPTSLLLSLRERKCIYVEEPVTYLSQHLS